MKIICIGRVKEKSISALIDEYLKRIQLEVQELKDSNSLQEGKVIMEKLQRAKSPYIICMSEEGRSVSSVEFSSMLKKVAGEGKEPIFIIGGPDGLSDEVKKKADILLSLSRMTFTHEMARLFLIEQIYRADTILKNKSYHR